MYNEKSICGEFENNLFHYIEKELETTRHELFTQHLQTCSKCARLLSDSNAIVETSRQSDVDILDYRVDAMITNAVRKKSFSFPEILFNNKSTKKIFYWKVAFASILIIASLSISLFSKRSNTVKVASKEILDWEGSTVDTEIKKINQSINSLNESDWNAELTNINISLKLLEKQVDKYSFN